MPVTTTFGQKTRRSRTPTSGGGTRQSILVIANRIYRTENTSGSTALTSLDSLHSWARRIRSKAVTNTDPSEPVEVTTTDVVIDGVRSVVRESAPHGSDRDREAVVFVHGVPSSGEDWNGLLPQVGEFARAVAPDMPGYGKADRPSDFDYTAQGYGRHLAKLLNQLGVEKVHLVLHDFGATWGLNFASNHPDQIASFTFFNNGVLVGYRWHGFARIWRTPIVGELFQLTTTRRTFRAFLNGGNPKPFPKEFVERMYDDIDWPVKRAILKLYRATDDPGAMSLGYGESLKPRSIPALVIWADNDPYIPVKHAEAQSDYFDADIHILPDCGHWPMIDEPERVSELVLPFLRRQVRGEAQSLNQPAS